jgi:hypothetical protein
MPQAQGKLFRPPNRSAAMLDFAELQLITNFITNIMVMMKNGKTLNDEEWVAYNSCLRTLQLHNKIRRHISRGLFKDLKNGKIEIETQQNKTRIIVKDRSGEDEQSD